MSDCHPENINIEVFATEREGAFLALPLQEPIRETGADAEDAEAGQKHWA